MHPAMMVEDLDIVEELLRRHWPRGEAFVMNQLVFQDAEKTFRDRIISTITFMTHTLLAGPRGEPFFESGTRILAPAIRVNERRDRSSASTLPVQKGPYLGVGRDVVRFEFKSNRRAARSIVVADPDFDLGARVIFV
jgi:hypothetical protein